MVEAIELRALKFCDENKLRLTEPRLEVLKIISLSSKPIKAYEILDKLSEVINNPKPPTAYRAIEFWQKYNFVHRIESLNSYMICEADHLHKGSQYMICDGCGIVIETHLCKLPAALAKSIKKKTFIPSRWSLEINGMCGQCI